ncbi:MAG TPA: arylesterase [Vicinamibacterales bacterium]
MISILFLLALIAALPAEAAGAKPSVPLRIVAFGDSLTSGHRLPQKDAYPAVIQKRLKAAGLPFAIVNHGVSGDTTTRALRRLDSALAEKPQIVIIELGVNDGLRGVPVPQIKANLEKIIAAAQEQNAEVLLCAMEALPLNGWQYTIEFHQMYEDLAMKYGVPLVPFLMNGVLGNPDLIGDDGVHPNAAGARFIADTIWEYLEPMARKMASEPTRLDTR